MGDLVALGEFLVAHPTVLLLVVGWYLFNAAASSMPPPEKVAVVMPDRPGALLIYGAVFAMMQKLAGNLARIYPQLRLMEGKNNGSPADGL